MVDAPAHQRPHQSGQVGPGGVCRALHSHRGPRQRSAGDPQPRVGYRRPHRRLHRYRPHHESEIRHQLDAGSRPEVSQQLRRLLPRPADPDRSGQLAAAVDHDSRPRHCHSGRPVPAMHEHGAVRRQRSEQTRVPGKRRGQPASGAGDLQILLGGPGLGAGVDPRPAGRDQLVVDQVHRPGRHSRVQRRRGRRDQRAGL